MRIQRLDIADLLDDNLSLQPYLAEALQKAYLKGLQLAVRETNFAKRQFSENLPYNLPQVLSNTFYPGSPSDLID